MKIYLLELRSIEWDTPWVIFDDFCWLDVKSDWLLLTEFDDEGDWVSSEEI